ncbi:MAG TPA: glycosyltransferase [Myxococcota bacterium]|nr:glycosyltransferase [Myxococcota bacterium]
MRPKAGSRPGVAILCNWWNHPELLDGFCAAVAGEAWDELVVVDNASDPDASAQLERRIGELGGCILRRESNSQLGGVRDAVAATCSETLILLNNDVRPKRSGWVARMAARVEPGVLCGHELRAKLGVPYVDGWCLGVRRADWERLGGYDSAYEEPPYWADVELSFRAERLGFELRAGDFGLEHECSVSIRGFRHERWFAELRRRNERRLVDGMEQAGARAATVRWEAPPINFFGPISGNMGLGVAARNWLHFLLAAGIEVHAVDVPDASGRSGHAREFLPVTHGLDEPAPDGVNVFCMNPWSFREFAAEGHRAVVTEGRVNAVIPYWEFPRIPDDWGPGLAMMDLVVAPTRFIEGAVRAGEPEAEVVYLPQPFETGGASMPDRAGWGVAEDAFLVVAGFEVASDVERKNPWALLEAFERAFPGDERARLILKLNNGRIWERYEEPVRQLRERCARDPRIRLLDEVLPYADVLSLYATADAYVSLHRAEGLGLGMLEAMSVGTPVVATGWSGNLDYMTHGNAFLVDYTLVPVRPSNQVAYRPEVVGEDARWAEPDPEHAARHLRRLAADPEAGRARSRRALRDLARRREATQPAILLAALQRAASAGGRRAPPR